MQVKWYYRTGLKGARTLHAKLASDSYRRPGARTPTYDSLGPIASIKEQNIDSPTARRRFWVKARAKLSGIQSRDPDEYQKLITSLAKRVPEPVREGWASEIALELNSKWRETAENLLQLHRGRVWVALGYASWKEFVEKEFLEKGTLSAEAVKALLVLASRNPPI